MKITAAKRIRGQQYLLTLDGEDDREVEVDAATFERSGYRIGGEISPQGLAELLTVSRRNRVRSRALYYLSDRDYAARELETKLCRMTERQTAHEVVERLTAVGLVNDAAYARRQAQNLAQYRLYPKRRILQELRAKGIDRETAEAAVEAAEIDDFQLALALIQKKYYNKLSDKSSREKTAAALARHGFGFDTVRRAMSAATEEAEDETSYC